MHGRIYNKGQEVSTAPLQLFGADLWKNEKLRAGWWVDPTAEVNEVRLPWWGLRPGTLPKKFHKFFRIKFRRSVTLDGSDGYPLNYALGIRNRFRPDPADEGERMATANDRAGYLRSVQVEKNPGFNWQSDNTLAALLGIGILIDAGLLIVLALPHIPSYIGGAGN